MHIPKKLRIAKVNRRLELQNLSASRLKSVISKGNSICRILPFPFAILKQIFSHSCSAVKPISVYENFTCAQPKHLCHSERNVVESKNLGRSPYCFALKPISSLRRRARSFDFGLRPSLRMTSVNFAKSCI